MNEQAVVDAVPLPALIIQSDERISHANGEACKLLGEAILRRHFITGLRQPQLLDTIEATIRDRSERQTRYLTNDGAQDTAFRVYVRPLDTSVLVTFVDETSLEQAGQMRRDFVANVSHELKTPLTALMGFIETLKGPAKNDEGARDRFLSIMETEASRMNRLVSDLLSLSRVEAEERVRPTTPVDLTGLVKSTIHSLSTLAEDADVQIRSDLPDDPAIIAGDEDQLRQVLVNLIENGIKYSGAGTTVTVSVGPVAYETRLKGDGIRLSVKDSGAGIDPVHLPRLTERFYRVDSHRSREKGGPGLGLAIVKHIVNRHRGRIRIESARGAGTDVTILLPV
ncbi:MAG: ATP-binding protein [Pseudomonadota bacterium]|nr:ATP-binding protein [Pseudomonadota bacterium]